jgi:hypothetical protein
MAPFQTDSLVLCYSNIEAATRWWIATFDCRQVKVPPDWDDPLPSDVALRLPGSPEPTILLCDQAEVQQAGCSGSNEHPIVFCTKLTKAHEYLNHRGAAPGPIQDGGGPQYFEIIDPEGNVIEICE